MPTERLRPTEAPHLDTLGMPSIHFREVLRPNFTLITREGREGQSLVCYGEEHHSHDLWSLQHETSVGLFEDFLAATSNAPQQRAVVIEGGLPSTPVEGTYEEVVRSGGTRLLFARLAEEHGIQLYSPDSGGYQEVALIPPSPDYHDYHRVLYHAMKFGPQLYRGGVVGDAAVRAFLEPRLQALEAVFAPTPYLKGNDFFSYEAVMTLYSLEYGMPFSVLDHEHLARETVGPLFPYEKTMAAAEESGVRNVARQVNALRDERFATLHQELWDQKKNIFTVFGEPHITNPHVRRRLEALGKASLSPFHNIPTPRSAGADVYSEVVVY